MTTTSFDCKTRSRAGKNKSRAGSGKYKSRAGTEGQGQDLGSGNTKYPKRIRVFLSSLYCKKLRIQIYLTKTVFKNTSNTIVNLKKVDLDESYLNR